MRTRFIPILLSLMLVFAFTSSAMADDGYYVMDSSATVNNPDPADRLNLRTGPSEDAPTLGKYYNGTFVETIGEEKDGWVKVRFCNLVVARPLVIEDSILHVKIDDSTGFYFSFDQLEEIVN